MKIQYLKALDRITFLKSEIERHWKEGQVMKPHRFEDKQADPILENLIEDLDIAAHRLKRLSLPVIEGKLQEDPYREKFELIRDDNGEGIGYQFSSADYLEVWDEEEKEWQTGRVEHTSRDGHSGYYFFCPSMGNPFLYTGMKARIRRE